MGRELQYIIQKLGLLKEKYDLIRDKEEKFNIFSILYKDHEERKLHSRFIAALLDPFASHEMKYTFLMNFVSQFEEIDSSNFKNAIVYPEEWNKKENNNIDILIIDRTTKNAIIIENKINAGDSNNESGGQLERYYIHVRDNEKIPENNISVLYLTLDGHSPSEESLGEFKSLERINGKCISYGNDIIDWLKLCIKEAYNQPFLRESILQYEKLINKMTNNETNIEERLKIKETIAQSKETMLSTKYLLDNFKHVKWHTISDFWSQLEKEILDNDYKIMEIIGEEEITSITHFEYNKKEEEGGVKFQIAPDLKAFVWHEKNEYLYWGFEKDGTTKETIEKFDKLCEQGAIDQNESDWWNFFEFSDNEKLWLKDFSNQKTFDLIDSRFRNETVKKLIKDISRFYEINIKSKSS